MSFAQTDAIRVSARMSYEAGGQDLINTMHVELLSPSSLTDAEVVEDIGELLEVYYGEIITVQGAATKYVDYTVQNLTADAAPLQSDWPTFVDGDQVLALLPPQIAALILARTSVSRKFGRIYLPGLTEAGTLIDKWDGTTLTALTAFAAELLVTQVLTNGNWRYAVKTALSPDPPTVANSYDIPLTTSLILPTRTQRRRSSSFGS